MRRLVAPRNAIAALFAFSLLFVGCTERADEFQARHEMRQLQELATTPSAENVKESAGASAIKDIRPTATDPNPGNLAPDVQERIQAMGGSVEGDAAATAPIAGGETRPAHAM